MTRLHRWKPKEPTTWMLWEPKDKNYCLLFEYVVHRATFSCLPYLCPNQGYMFHMTSSWRMHTTRELVVLLAGAATVLYTCVWRCLQECAVIAQSLSYSSSDITYHT
jgi:hypothetical protein